MRNAFLHRSLYMPKYAIAFYRETNEDSMLSEVN